MCFLYGDSHETAVPLVESFGFPTSTEVCQSLDLNVVGSWIVFFINAGKCMPQ